MTSKPNDFGMAIGALLISMAIFMANVSNNAQNWFTAGMFGVSAFGLTLILVNAPSFIIDVAYAVKVSAEHLYAAWQLTQGTKANKPNEPSTIENDEELTRRIAWKRHWQECASEVKAHNNTVAYNVKDSWGMSELMSYEQWHDSLAMPWVRQGWLSPVAGGVKTKLLKEISFIQDELAANRLPILPYGLPPKLEVKQEAQQAYA